MFHSFSPTFQCFLSHFNIRFAEQNVFQLSAVPHDWLLPFCCGAVHHGGAGTVAAVCRAGIPQAVLPVAWDQPWWAEHLEQMGLGAAADFMALFKVGLVGSM